MQLEGRRVVSAGGASVIGLAIATRLADYGCQIILADSDAAALRVCAEESEAFYAIACDGTQQDALEALADFSWLP